MDACGLLTVSFILLMMCEYLLCSHMYLLPFSESGDEADDEKEKEHGGVPINQPLTIDVEPPTDVNTSHSERYMKTLRLTSEQLVCS